MSNLIKFLSILVVILSICLFNVLLDTKVFPVSKFELEGEGTYGIFMRPYHRDFFVAKNKHDSIAFMYSTDDLKYFEKVFDEDDIDFTINFNYYYKSGWNSFGSFTYYVNEDGFYIYDQEISILILNKINRDILDFYNPIIKNISVIKLPCVDENLFKHDFFKKDIDSIILDSCPISVKTLELLYEKMIDVYTLNPSNMMVLRSKGKISNLYEIPLKKKLLAKKIKTMHNSIR